MDLLKIYTIKVLVMLSSFFCLFLTMRATMGDYSSDINELTNKQALAILGLSFPCLKKATLQSKNNQEIIKKAYRKLVMKYHPDKAAQNGVTAEQAEKAFKNVNAAYQRLTQLNTVKLDDIEEYGIKRTSTFNGGFSSSHDPFGDDLFAQMFGQPSFDRRSSSHTSFNSARNDPFADFFFSAPRPPEKKEKTFLQKVEDALAAGSLRSVRDLLLDPTKHPRASFINDACRLTNNNGDSLLHVAIKDNDKELVLLFMQKIDVNKVNSVGENALHVAAQYCTDPIIFNGIVLKSSDINNTDSSYKTPLRIAVEANNLMAAKALLAAGASVKECYFGYHAPESCATSQEMKDLFKKEAKKHDDEKSDFSYEHNYEEDMHNYGDAGMHSSSKSSYSNTKHSNKSNNSSGVKVVGLVSIGVTLILCGSVAYKNYKEYQARKARRDAFFKREEERKKQELEREKVEAQNMTTPSTMYTIPVAV